MRIKLLKAFGFSEPGDVLDPDPPVAQLLIDRGVAVAIAAQQRSVVANTCNKAIKSGRLKEKHAGISLNVER